VPSNVEIKAVLNDIVSAQETAARLSGRVPETIRQEDVFFRCAGARLKLRILDSQRGELIRYERVDSAVPRCSHYLIAHTSDPGILRDILTQTLGVSGIVKKRRDLYLVGQTRVHIDRVEGLGDFLELEVVLREDQDEIEGRRIAAELLSKFAIDGQQLVAKAYVDLLASQF
jgi:predicted adenylyl cyclase CyaB